MLYYFRSKNVTYSISKDRAGCGGILIDRRHGKCLKTKEDYSIGFTWFITAAKQSDFVSYTDDKEMFYLHFIYIYKIDVRKTVYNKE